MRRVRNNKKFIDFPVAQEVDTTVYRKTPSKDLTQIHCSNDMYKFISVSWEGIDHVETMKAVFMNRSNKVLGVKTVATGGIDTVIVDVRIIFQAALLCNATSLILVHNHPSGGLRPSDGDGNITRKVREAGVVMNIKLLDHLIISDEGYYSFADQGML